MPRRIEVPRNVLHLTQRLCMAEVTYATGTMNSLFTGNVCTEMLTYVIIARDGWARKSLYPRAFAIRHGSCSFTRYRGS